MFKNMRKFNIKGIAAAFLALQRRDAAERVIKCKAAVNRRVL